MEKRGVVTGTVKTAEADNRGDPVGTAARCIKDAKESVSALKAAVESASPKDKKEK